MARVRLNDGEIVVCPAEILEVDSAEEAAQNKVKKKKKEKSKSKSKSKSKEGERKEKCKEEKESDRKIIHVAYWRDPVKVKKEREKYSRLKSTAPRQKVLRLLDQDPTIAVEEISTSDIFHGRLTVTNFDLLIVPGGYAPHYDEALGFSDEDDDPEGYKAVRKFVQDGGGYMGICAGAYLGSNYALGFVNVEIVDIENWNRGMSQRTWLTYSRKGKQVFDTTVDEVVVRYANGPLLKIASGQDESNVHVLARYASDFARKKSCRVGLMEGSPAIVASDNPGFGRCILISPHLEDGEPVTERHFLNLCRWLARDSPLKNGTVSRNESSQSAARGKWWKTLKKLSTKKYPPSLRDYGVPDSLSRLRRDVDLATSLDGKKERKRGVKKEPAIQHRSIVNFRHDGYSMLKNGGSSAYAHIEVIAGPILITAPHGLNLAAPRRCHLREKYTTEIVLKLAKALRSYLGIEASFCVWNAKTAKRKDRHNLDANFLFKSEWTRSPFHRSLQKFRAKFLDRGLPCLHIDLHGKRDRKKHSVHQIDVGMEPFVQHHSCCQWTEEQVDLLRSILTREIDKEFEGLRCGGKAVKANPDPRLHGWWGDDDSDDGSECETTMTHQAILSGIPSVQLENPRAVRERLVAEDVLIERMAKALFKAYEKVCEVEAENASSSRAHQAMSFFVYGSLRPDDLTNMPWRDKWLQQSVRCIAAEVNGRMFDDEFACVVLESGRGNENDNNKVKGYVVQFPNEIMRAKIEDADDIEDCPELYQRETTVATANVGGRMVEFPVYIYTRDNCSKSRAVKSGDWVSHTRAKSLHRDDGKYPVESVAEFIAAAYPEYRGQHESYGGSRNGGLAGMIDQIIDDTERIDRKSSERQI
eukprot:g3072.t1